MNPDSLTDMHGGIPHFQTGKIWLILIDYFGSLYKSNRIELNVFFA